jgi:hypothetical protein
MEGPNLINGWPQKGAGDLLGEAIIARALTDLGQDKDETGARTDAGPSWEKHLTNNQQYTPCLSGAMAATACLPQ